MIIGHQKQWELLKKSAESERLSHALLFSGQDQIGKRALAVEFTKFLNCKESKKPCNDCRSCRDIGKGMYPDLIQISPVKKEIQIAQIRDTIQKLSLYPYSSPYKVAIIDQAHLMSSESQNCFLKTLEEPTGKTLLILVTEYPEVLLPTILSRIQKIRFFPAKKKEIYDYLINEGAIDKKAEYLSSLEKPGMAIDFFLDEEKIKNQEKIISDLNMIKNSDFGVRFKYAKEVPNVKEILDVWLRHFRGLFLSSLKGNSEAYSLIKLKKIISLIQSTSYLLSTTNINPKLAFELLLIEI